MNGFLFLFFFFYVLGVNQTGKRPCSWLNWPGQSGFYNTVDQIFVTDLYHIYRSLKSVIPVMVLEILMNSLLSAANALELM